MKLELFEMPNGYPRLILKSESDSEKRALCDIYEKLFRNGEYFTDDTVEYEHGMLTVGIDGINFKEFAKSK